MRYLTSVIQVIWRHKWTLLSISLTIGTQIASRIIVNHFEAMGLWVYRSELHFVLARTHFSFGLIAILLAVLAVLREPPLWVGGIALGLGVLNILGTAV